MCACMCVNICVHVYVYICVRMYMCMYMSTNGRTRAWRGNHNVTVHTAYNDSNHPQRDVTVSCADRRRHSVTSQRPTLPARHGHTSR